MEVGRRHCDRLPPPRIARRILVSRLATSSSSLCASAGGRLWPGLPASRLAGPVLPRVDRGEEAGGGRALKVSTCLVTCIVPAGRGGNAGERLLRAPGTKDLDLDQSSGALVVPPAWRRQALFARPCMPAMTSLGATRAWSASRCGLTTARFSLT
jgi:hypothetical protein